jgi:cysteine desulfurase
MYANTEVGTINPIAEMALLAAERKILFHTDAVQAFGKLPIDVRQIPVSLLSISGHKIYGPKGMGALFVRCGVKLHPLLFGGHQERDRRAGTENVAGIVGLGRAAEVTVANQAAEAVRLRLLSEKFWQRLRQIFPDTAMNGNPESRLPAVLNLSFPGFESTALLMSLDLQGIAVSNGSACSSGSVEVSHVLRAMKISRNAPCPLCVSVLGSIQPKRKWKRRCRRGENFTTTDSSQFRRITFCTGKYFHNQRITAFGVGGQRILF